MEGTGRTPANWKSLVRALCLEYEQVLVVYVNGVYNTPSSAKAAATKIKLALSEQTNLTVRSVFNPTFNKTDVDHIVEYCKRSVIEHWDSLSEWVRTKGVQLHENLGTPGTFILVTVVFVFFCIILYNYSDKVCSCILVQYTHNLDSGGNSAFF